MESTKCIECEKPHGLKDIDAGSDRELQRLCKNCFRNSRVILSNEMENQELIEKIEIYKDRKGNIYVKTGRETGFMTRISDGTLHDGTTVGDFELIDTHMTEGEGETLDKLKKAEAKLYLECSLEDYRTGVIQLAIDYANKQHDKI